MNRPRECRRGAVLVSALICLLVVMSIVTTMISGALARRRQLSAERNERQAAMLVSAGRDWALSLLRQGRDDVTESWTPQVSEAPVATTAEVSVSITAEKAGHQIRVVATYPAGDPFAVRRSQSFLIPRPSKKTEE